MKTILTIILSSLTLAGCTSQPAGEVSTDYPISSISFTDVKFTDDFWAPRIKTNQEVTIPIALHQCEITGRVDNFKKAAGLMDGYFNTEYPFDDTDIYKILEGASYSIQMFPNAALEARMDTLISLIVQAQEKDGYLFTPRTAGEPGNLHKWVGEKRWEKTPDLSHELYNCGHLYEAAVAHYQATGKRTLLDVAIKSADLLVRDFGPGKLTYEPGHQIVEMGLVKMYRATGKKEYLDLARFFLNLKGNGERGAYCQSHKPVTEQDEAVGHAVRAVYMYSGMADVAALTGDPAYQKAIDNIWNNVVSKKYYITGGIGARHDGEAFGENYELPNHSAYCETCAAIGNVYWNHRQFLNHGEAKYYDVLERTLYNGVISGISLSGDHFFYPNPLESHGDYTRSEWFGCACCPSNLCRFMASIPGYVYAQKDDQVYVNLYVDSHTEIQAANQMVSLNQKTGYPWDGKIDITVDPQKDAQFTLKLRVPGWAQNKPVPSDLYTYINTSDQKSGVTLSLNNKPIDYRIGADGYIAVNREWNKGDVVSLSLPMTINRTITNENVEANTGRVSVERGPILYCLESIDNKEDVLKATLADNATLEYKWEADLLGGVVTINSNETKAIPYYAWDNRGKSNMIVWVPRNQ
ncbi:glycoside hydrolase family 127 protein [Bacteroides sp. 51]|uniref:glycoside hydrolase family 127 protein n=1 Tax=Bacteroides sp. 51 TaxID=2302938 RepID=UPI0013D5C829|nr:glycoside hydrolase family 127 protein [Bacteroides sp. 51]NDV84150.1 glycoside hydrolase family 127 protein [Bacteroides sp. 51]